MQLDSTDARILKFLQDNPSWFTRREIAHAIGKRQLSNRRIDTLKHFQSTGEIFEWVGVVIGETAAQYRLLYRAYKPGDEKTLSVEVNRNDGLVWHCRTVWWKVPVSHYEY